MSDSQTPQTPSGDDQPTGGRPADGQPAGNNPAGDQRPEPRYGQNAPLPPQQPGPYGQQAPGPYGQQAPGPYGQQAPGPYGQQAPGPYGQQAPGPYGQQAPGPYGYPNQPAPYGGPFRPPGPPPAPPQEVQIGTLLILAGALVYVITTIFSMLNARALINSAEFRDALEATGTQVTINTDSLAGLYAAVTGVVGAIGLALYLVVAANVRSGRGWARILGTVLAVLSLFSLANGWLAALSVLLGVAGIVLLWLRPSNDFFRYFSRRR